MDTIVGLEGLLMPTGSDHVFLVPEGRRVVIPGGQNVRGAEPRVSNASILRTLPRVEVQSLRAV